MLIPDRPRHRAGGGTSIALESFMVTEPTPGAVTGHSPRILFANGDDAMRALFREALEPSGYVVELAADADEALRQARAGPDLILVETSLPLGDPSLIGALHAAAPRAHIILLVCLGDDGLGARARELGADLALAMPVHLSELQAGIGGLLGWPQPRPPAEGNREAA